MNKAISAGSKFYERNKLKECTIWDYFIWNGQESLSEEIDSKTRMSQGQCGAEPSTLRDSKLKNPEAGDIWLDPLKASEQRKVLSEMDMGSWGGGEVGRGQTVGRFRI